MSEFRYVTHVAVKGRGPSFDGITYVIECCARQQASFGAREKLSWFRNDRASNLVTALSKMRDWRAYRSAKSRERRILHRPPQRQKHHKSLTLKLVRDRHYDIDDVALSARSCNLQHVSVFGYYSELGRTDLLPWTSWLQIILPFREMHWTSFLYCNMEA